MPAELDREFVQGSAAGGNQSNVASLAAAAGKRNYLTGYTIVMGGATAGTQVNATINNLATGTRTISVDVPVGANVAPTIIRASIFPPQPATGLNQQIGLTLPAGGAGNTVASVDLEGFRLPEP